MVKMRQRHPCLDKHLVKDHKSYIFFILSDRGFTVQAMDPRRAEDGAVFTVGQVTISAKF